MERNEFFPIGRMLSGSKTCPKGHVCVFNANICIRSEGKIWFGDLDLSRDVAKLADFAKSKGETIYVLREIDARFRNESKPLYENAVATISPEGIMELHESFL